MTLQEIKKLHDRCLSGLASTEEQAIFEQYKDQFELADIPWTDDMGDQEIVRNKLRKKLDAQIRRHHLIHRSIYYWPAAASLILIFGIAWLLFKDKKSITRVKRITHARPVIKPGGNKAILILANSQSINLDSSKLGNVATQNNTAIVKNKNQLLQYKSENSITKNSSSSFNTLITPRGGQYELQLSDGTKVWLNADSRLRFPVNFTGKERVVELTGEAYFEVTKNKKMPFKVISATKTVEVLGTHFNVSAYPNEFYQTTLLQGSVKLNLANGGSAILRPNEQGSLNAKNQFDVSKADTSAIVAWKNGIFLFRNEGIKNVMNQIARWYDVDVSYKGEVADLKLGGTVSRYANIAKLLNTIELTGSVHFKIEGRRIIVMQ